MDGVVPFGGPDYFVFLGLLVFSRGMDFLSTWIATPRLVLEGNPFVKFLGWKWGAALNSAVCIVLARWPVPAIVISTASVLVAARNFQLAWLMRSVGEEPYGLWHAARLRETRAPLFLGCLFAQTFLTAAVGGAAIWFSPNAVTQAIGAGIVCYAGAVVVYTLLSFWRIRRTGGYFPQT